MEFVTLRYCDHDGVVRIFVGHSEIVKRLLINYLDYLEYIMRHNFLYTRSVIYAAQFFLYQECNDEINSIQFNEYDVDIGPAGSTYFSYRYRKCARI